MKFLKLIEKIKNAFDRKIIHIVLYSFPFLLLIYAPGICKAYNITSYLIILSLFYSNSDYITIKLVFFCLLVISFIVLFRYETELSLFEANGCSYTTSNRNKLRERRNFEGYNINEDYFCDLNKDKSSIQHGMDLLILEGLKNLFCIEQGVIPKKEVKKNKYCILAYNIEKYINVINGNFKFKDIGSRAVQVVNNVVIVLKKDFIIIANTNGEGVQTRKTQKMPNSYCFKNVYMFLILERNKIALLQAIAKEHIPLWDNYVP